MGLKSPFLIKFLEFIVDSKSLIISLVRVVDVLADRLEFRLPFSHSGNRSNLHVSYPLSALQ